MKNEDMMTLNLNRLELYDIRLALTKVIIGFKCELNEEGIREDRMEVAQRSLAKWEALKAKVVAQIDQQDV